MLFVYGVSLILLLIILGLLWKEERRLRKTVTHGLADKYWILRERRRYVRFKEELKIRYDILRKIPNFRNSKTINISKSGLYLLTYEKLKERSYISLELELPDFSKPVKVIGQVAWTKDLEARDAEGRRLFSVGIKFSRINPESEAMLLTHLARLKER